MSQPFQFSPATRLGLKPLIGLYGESNSGKTYSALLLARGIAGAAGKVLGIDTESGRMSLYADEIPGGFQVSPFDPPFSPTRYTQALDAAEQNGADVIVFDSFSHEWFGEGGVLDMASENEARSGKPGLHVWKQPKLEHSRLVMRLLRSKTFVIVCLRAKYKSRQVKDDRGKNTIVKDDHVSPEQDESLLFEMTAHCEMQTSNPGMIRLTKWSVPDLANCFPEDGKEKLGIKHGELIAKWANSGGKSAPHPAQSSQPDDFLLAVREAPDADDLMSYVEQANGLSDEERKKIIKTAIAKRAGELGLKWDVTEKSFVKA